jgi:hypothetical protein
MLLREREKMDNAVNLTVGMLLIAIALFSSVFGQGTSFLII